MGEADGRDIELWGVRHVEALGAELEFERFVETEIFENGHVERPSGRPCVGLVAEVSICIWRRRGEIRDIEPLGRRAASGRRVVRTRPRSDVRPDFADVPNALIRIDAEARAGAQRKNAVQLPVADEFTNQRVPIGADIAGGRRYGGLLYVAESAAVSEPERGSFLVWFEDHSEALAIAPAMPKGEQSGERLNLHELIATLGMMGVRQPGSNAQCALGLYYSFSGL